MVHITYIKGGLKKIQNRERFWSKTRILGKEFGQALIGLITLVAVYWILVGIFLTK